MSEPDPKSAFSLVTREAPPCVNCSENLLASGLKSNKAYQSDPTDKSDPPPQKKSKASSIMLCFQV